MQTPCLMPRVCWKMLNIIERSLKILLRIKSKDFRVTLYHVKSMTLYRWRRVSADKESLNTSNLLIGSENSIQIHLISKTTTMSLSSS